MNKKVKERIEEMIKLYTKEECRRVEKIKNKLYYSYRKDFKDGDTVKILAGEFINAIGTVCRFFTHGTSLCVVVRVGLKWIDIEPWDLEKIE